MAKSARVDVMVQCVLVACWGKTNENFTLDRGIVNTSEYQ